MNPVVLLLILSIWLIVLSLGARTTPRDAFYVIRNPRLLAPAMAAIFIIVPAFAVLLCRAFALAPEIKLAIVALTVSPTPPILPLKQARVGSANEYAIGLLVAAAIVSLVATPLLLAVAASILGANAAISLAPIARTMLVSIGLPLAAGMALKALAPRLAPMVQRYALVAGAGLLLIGLVFLLVHSGKNILALVGNGALASIVAVVAVGLLVGHLLGGGRGADRGALALAAATRHPGLALAIARLNYPDQLQGAMAAILLFVLVNLIVTAPYVIWMGKRAKRATPAPETPVA
jgi:BASS family bile acid:Na+ symporter